MRNGQLLEKAHKIAAPHMGKLSMMISCKRVSLTATQEAARALEEAARLLRRVQ